MNGERLRFLRTDVVTMSAYTAGSREDGIALQRNEAPTELPDALRDEILEAVRRLSWRRYPDIEQTRLRADARRALDLAAGLDVRFGNGSNELIQALIAACARPGDAVVIPLPTFPVYERITRLHHADPAFVPPRRDLTFDVAEILDTARQRQARVVFLCRPNNPTGHAVSLEEADWLASRLDALLVIDEAYVEFAGETAVSLAEQRENVVLLRTFSKALRSAGLRIGYAIGHAEVLSEVAKALPPYNLGVIASETARRVLERRAAWEPELAEITAERERLRLRLAALPHANAMPSSANFICLRTPFESSDLSSRLADRGVVVRNLSEHPGLSDAVRITVGTREENDRLLAALRAVWREP